MGTTFGISDSCRTKYAILISLIAILGFACPGSSQKATASSSKSQAKPAVTKGDSKTDELAVLKKRIEVLEAREDISSLISRYSLDVDMDRTEDMLKLFTDDCVFGTDITGQMAYQHGKQELKEKFATPPPKSEHLHLDMAIHVESDDTATAYGYQMISSSKNNAVSIGRIALRAFTFRRVNGVWLIKEAIAGNIDNDKLIPTLK